MLFLAGCDQETSVADPQAEVADDSSPQGATESPRAEGARPPGFLSGVEAAYQADMDRIRISHVDFLVTLMLEYANRADRLPLQAQVREQEILVYVTHRNISAALNEQAAALPVEQYTSAALEEDIEAVLGREIQMPSDPQNVATYAPNVYIYQVDRERACVAGHLYSPTEKTKNVANRYHKYEVCIRPAGN
jgi:hypothetical protein